MVIPSKSSRITFQKYIYIYFKVHFQVLFGLYFFLAAWDVLADTINIGRSEADRFSCTERQFLTTLRMLEYDKKFQKPGVISENLIPVMKDIFNIKFRHSILWNSHKIFQQELMHFVITSTKR